MAMIRVCKECGFEFKGCPSCNKQCELCGGDIIAVDLVKYILRKEQEKKNGKSS